MFQRQTQSAFGKNLAKRAERNLNALRNLLVELRGTSLNIIFIHKLFQVADWIRHQIQTFEFVKQRYNIHRLQQDYLSALSNLDQQLQSFELTIKGQIMTLGYMLKAPSLIQWLIQGQASQLNQHALRHIIETVDDLLEMMTLISDENKQSKFGSMFQECMLGSYNELRAYIELSHNVERFFFTTSDGHQLDCILVLCDKEDYAKYPVMMFCNPNGAAYETLFHDTHWPDFYLQHQISVLMWNYRGYGHSEGRPSTIHFQRDGEGLVDYLKNVKHFKKVGVHGYSLGGQVACYLARHKQLDYLFADRTFSSLGDVGQYMFGPKLSMLLGLLTDWNRNVYNDYIDFHGDKLIALDPRDEIIPFEASLVSGVALQVFLQNQRFQPAIHQWHTTQIQKVQKAFYGSMVSEKDFETAFNILKNICSPLIQLVAEDQSAFSGPPTVSNRVEPNLIDISADSFIHAFTHHKGFFVSLFHLLCCFSNGFISVTEFFEKERTIEQFTVQIYGLGNRSSLWWDKCGVLHHPSACNSRTTWRYKTMKFNQSSWKRFDKFLEDFGEEGKIISQLKWVSSKLKHVMEHNDSLTEICDSNDQILQINETGYTQYLSQAIGEVFIVDCGHNGSYTAEETNAIRRVLLGSSLF